MREVPLKNYLILGLVFVLTIGILFYINEWAKTIEKEKLSKSIISEVVNSIKETELETMLLENPDSIVYTSILGNRNIQKFEKKFKDVIQKNDFVTDIVHLDFTEANKDKSVRQKFLRQYNINGESITNLPNIMVFKGGKLYDIYNIRANDYDINLLVEYLEENNIIVESK